MPMIVIGILIGVAASAWIYIIFSVAQSSAYHRGYQDALFDQHKADIEKIRLAILDLQVEPNEQKEGNENSEED